mmetsp:Transcript_17814/g.43611  ORF Transcript_17814/g.43611 Transcript_17814/m.43611 type:complete len:202 (+) Transcript_17814:175-780(+)
MMSDRDVQLRNSVEMRAKEITISTPAEEQNLESLWRPTVAINRGRVLHKKSPATIQNARGIRVPLLGFVFCIRATCPARHSPSTRLEVENRDDVPHRLSFFAPRQAAGAAGVVWSWRDVVMGFDVVAGPYQQHEPVSDHQGRVGVQRGRKESPGFVARRRVHRPTPLRQVQRVQRPVAGVVRVAAIQIAAVHEHRSSRFAN